MSIFVIVDGSDQDLVYSTSATQNAPCATLDAERNGWCMGIGTTAEFLVTSSASGNASSTVSFEFEGSSISVFGSIAAASADDETSIAFYLDGEQQTTYTLQPQAYTRYHQTFFSSPSLLSLESKHNLSIEVLTSQVSQPSDFYLDYIIYEAVENSTISGSSSETTWIFVDDTSPYLQYSDSGWSSNVPGLGQSDTFNLTDASFNSSLMGPTGAGAAVSLTMTGTRTIRAYATILEGPSLDVLGSFKLDGDSSPQNLSVLPESSEFPLVNFEIMTATVDEEGYHTLEIEAAAENIFFLDYILLQSSSAFISSAFMDSSLPPPHSDSSTSSFTVFPDSSTSGINSISATASGNSVPTAAPINTRSRVDHKREIVGGVVGSVVCIVAIFIIARLYLRSARKGEIPTVTPFDYVTPDGLGSSGVVPSMRGGNENESNKRHPDSTPSTLRNVMAERSIDPYPRLSPSHTHDPQDSVAAPSVQGIIDQIRALIAALSGSSMASGSRRIMMENDSGLRGVGDGDSQLLPVPPMYTEH